METPNSGSNQHDEMSQEANEEISDSHLTPLYALFILPLLIIFSAISLTYLRQCLHHQIANLIRLVDNYMVSADVGDSDQTPVNVLQRLDAIATNDEICRLTPCGMIPLKEMCRKWLMIFLIKR